MDRLKVRGNSLQQTGPRAEKQNTLQQNKEPAFFGTQQEDSQLLSVYRELKKIDINAITPLDALGLINKWQDKLLQEKSRISLKKGGKSSQSNTENPALSLFDD